jgi:nitrate reductase beta subunit
MLWNNVETKPYGFYPLAWDVELLNQLGPQAWDGGVYRGRTVFEAAPAGERVLGWRPTSADYAYPNVGEDEIVGKVDKGAAMSLPQQIWMFYLARICNHCTYPACLASCPRSSIYKRPEDGIVVIDQERCRGYQECVRACPYKKVYFNPSTGTSEKCIACFPKIEQGIQPQCFVNCIGKIRLQGWVNTPGRHARTTQSTISCTSASSRCRSTRSSGSSRTSTTCRPSTCRRRSSHRCSGRAPPPRSRSIATPGTTAR